MPKKTNTSGLLGKRLRDERERVGLGQAQCAKMAGISQGTLSALESGRNTSMDAPTLLGLCAVFKVRPTWLYYGKGPKERATTAFLEQVKELVEETGTGDLSKNEKELIVAYRRCSIPYRRFIMHMALNEPGEQSGTAEIVNNKK